MRVDWCVSSWFRIKNTHSLTHPYPPMVFRVEVLEVDILWPRWVARIGVTRSTEASYVVRPTPPHRAA